MCISVCGENGVRVEGGECDLEEMKKRETRRVV